MSDPSPVHLPVFTLCSSSLKFKVTRGWDTFRDVIKKMKSKVKQIVLTREKSSLEMLLWRLQCALGAAEACAHERADSSPSGDRGPLPRWLVSPT